MLFKRNSRFYTLEGVTLNLLMQHPWSSTIRMAIDLEAMGIGGKSSIFQVVL